MGFDISRTCKDQLLQEISRSLNIRLYKTFLKYKSPLKCSCTLIKANSMEVLGNLNIYPFTIPLSKEGNAIILISLNQNEMIQHVLKMTNTEKYFITGIQYSKRS